MSILNIVRIIVYRFHEKGLEVFLFDSDLKSNPDVWKLPKSKIENLSDLNLPLEYIEMDESVTEEDGVKTIAIEADWHEIPSIRGLLKNDVKIAKSFVKETIPGVEKGAYVAVKEVMKKSVPGQYKMLKDLKDILFDRNLLRNI